MIKKTNNPNNPHKGFIEVDMVTLHTMAYGCEFLRGLSNRENEIDQTDRICAENLCKLLSEIGELYSGILINSYKGKMPAVILQSDCAYSESEITKEQMDKVKEDFAKFIKCKASTGNNRIRN